MKKKRTKNKTADPIRNLKDVRAISHYLKSNPRNHLLFTIGINNGLRVNDIIRIQKKKIIDLQIGDYLTIIETKTRKKNILVINKPIYKALQIYLEQTPETNNPYLFPSRKGSGHIKSQAVGRMIKQWTSAINLTGHFGCHSLRKTFGYLQRTEYGVDFALLCKRFNHSSPTITMRYLGITDKEVHTMLLNEIA